MKNLLLLGTLSFSIAFGLGLVVEKDVTKSTIIGGIATISTISSAFVLTKKSERELKNTHSHTENLKSVENQILSLKNQRRELVQAIGSKTQSKITIEAEYKSIVVEVDRLKEEIKSLNAQRENLQNVIINRETQKTQITQKISVQTKLKRPIKKTKGTTLYNCILEGLEKSLDFYNKNNHGTFESYLQSLQKPAEQLWSSYRSNQVKVSYSEPSIQAVYLIRYYPHYVYVNFQVLEIIHSQNLFQNFINETLEVCLFGAGPCPEIVGLSKFLSDKYQNIKKLTVNVYDIASDEWTLSRNITQKFVIPKYWSGDLQLNSNYLNLCEFNSLHSIKGTIKKSQIFIFQNCLNEIYNISTVQTNLNFLLNEIPLGSVIIIIDLNYRQNVSIIEQLKQQVSNRDDFEIYAPALEDIKIQPCPNLPQIIKQNLLTGKGKLVPRSKDIDCVFISLHKISLKSL
ncbi:hypothetical protein [Tychonema sp. LEGE 06208]|uniref:hypothetical protein n=1 Tax=Tychonema sp. LEGE 06208 TaxID=1828663 RepID=UPI00187EA92C|nr:hypothetical protein [Tychonema sp. LEGE 06208]MBE9161801.1 hypothetical protein [Tychonema sp. LEGE 06208]